MKRRLVRLMLIGITAIALTGCSNLNEVIPPSNDELIEENEDTEDTDKEDSDNEDDNSVSSEGVARGNDSYVLARFPMADSFYVYDSETDSLRGINRYEMAEKTPNANPDIYRLYNEYDYYRSSLIGEGDGFFFFQDSVAFEEGGNSQSIVYAVKEDDYKIYDVWRNNGDGFIQGCEFYNGYIYIDYNIGYDENYTSLGEDVVCFKYDRITDSFTEGEVSDGLKKIIRAAGDIGAHIRRSGNFCNAHVFDECGYLPAVKDGELILIDSDGVTKNIPGVEEGYNAYYAESNIFTILVDYETGTGTVCVYDIKRDEIKEIIGDYTADRLLGKNGTKYYYSRTDSPEYGIKHNYIYEYDSESGNNRLLYDVKFAPGSDIFPGVEGFTLTDSFIYYVGFDSGSIFWVPVKIDDPSKEYPRIDLGSEELFNYGTIEYLSNTYECPDCNTDLVCTYVEYPVLNEYPSYNIDKINTVIASLSAKTEDMKNRCNETMETMRGLLAQNAEVIAGMKEIHTQISATNEAVKNIAEASQIITDISSQTNLLSLNASIEAARAGESGRGFAVVATEIGNLADQSGNAAVKISQIVKNLVEESEKSVATIEEMSVGFEKQNTQINSTGDDVKAMVSEVNAIANETEVIADQISDLNSAKESLVSIISELSAVSEENAASTQETNASMEELNATFSLISDSAGQLRQLASELQDKISFFTT